MLILHSSLQGPACPHPHHSLSEGQGPQRPHSEYPMTVDCTTHSLVKEERNFPTSSLLMERGRFPGFQTSLGSGWRAPPCLHGGKDGTGHGGLAHPEAARVAFCWYGGRGCCPGKASSPISTAEVVTGRVPGCPGQERALHSQGPAGDSQRAEQGSLTCVMHHTRLALLGERPSCKDTRRQGKGHSSVNVAKNVGSPKGCVPGLSLES